MSLDPLTYYAERNNIFLDSSPAIERNDPYEAEIHHFVEAVKTRTQPLIPVEQGVSIVEMLTAIVASAERRREVVLGLTRWRVTEGLQTPGKAHGESLSMHIGGVCVKKIAFAVSTLSSCLVLSCSNVVFADTSQEDINLTLNKPYTVSAPIPDRLLSADEQSWFPDTGGKLTDGKFLNPKTCSIDKRSRLGGICRSR